jgi:glutaredoxin
MPVLTLYRRPGCHLCTEARAVLLPLCQRLGLALEERDVDTDPALAARYGERIPVLALDGAELLAWPFTQQAARQALRERLGR